MSLLELTQTSHIICTQGPGNQKLYHQQRFFGQNLHASTGARQVQQGVLQAPQPADADPLDGTGMLPGGRLLHQERHLLVCRARVGAVHERDRATVQGADGRGDHYRCPGGQARVEGCRKDARSIAQDTGKCLEGAC